MAKIDKKIIKLEERIKELEEIVRENLTKKTSNTAEINVGKIQSDILQLKKQLQVLKKV
jgi:hypothetical protein